MDRFRVFIENKREGTNRFITVRAKNLDSAETKANRQLRPDETVKEVFYAGDEQQ